MIGFQSGRLQFTDLTSYPKAGRAGCTAAARTAMDGPPRAGKHHAGLVVTATAVSSSGV